MKALLIIAVIPSVAIPSFIVSLEWDGRIVLVVFILCIAGTLYVFSRKSFWACVIVAILGLLYLGMKFMMPSLFWRL
jgi:4-hydroxybenzoate polyprenyltransferase